MKVAQRALNALHRLEDWLIAALVLLLVSLAGAQILLRNFFDTGFSWADPLLRALVLWTGLLGALAAVREDKHISLDVLSRLLTGITLRLVRIASLGFAALICAVMAWFSAHLVSIDHEAGGIAFAGVPAWAVEVILPFAFGLMALRFALRAWAMPLGPHMPPGVPEDLLGDNS